MKKLLGLLITIAIAYLGVTHAPSSANSATTIAAPDTSLPVSAEEEAMPNPKLTPGAVHGTDLADICPHVDPALEAARPGAAVKRAVYSRYGIAHHVSGEYEVDHLIPLELDGSNDAANLWPELNDHPSTHVLNSKDLLENKLHSLVCAHALPLSQAQKEIATDWPSAYKKYVG